MVSIKHIEADAYEEALEKPAAKRLGANAIIYQRILRRWGRGPFEVYFMRGRVVGVFTANVTEQGLCCASYQSNAGLNTQSLPTALLQTDYEFPSAV